MAMWAQRRELATKFLFWPWCFITCICSQNEERKLTPQRKSVTSDDTQMYLDWCLDFSSFSTRHWFIVILRLESLREGVRNCSFLLHSNQNLPVAREAQWREWKDKVLAGTHPPQAILPLLLYPTGTAPGAGMSSASSSERAPAVRRLSGKMQSVIISQQTVPLRLSVGQLFWAINISCNSDQEH